MNRIGKNMKHAIEFFSKYEGGHCIDIRCEATRKAVERLVKMGLLKKNEFNQYRWI